MHGVGSEDRGGNNASEGTGTQLTEGSGVGHVYIRLRTHLQETLRSRTESDVYK